MRCKSCDYLEERVLGRGNGKCKGPEARICFVCDQGKAETSVAGVREQGT